MPKYLQGYYRPQNPQKYKGDPTNIVYRSSWQLSFMRWCDITTAVKTWVSEETVIPYISPIDNRYHRYFMDFKIEVIDATGKTKTLLIEIKPDKQTRPPRVQKKVTKSYINEVKTWGVNEAKWKAATAYAKKHGMEFHIITEKNLPGL